MKRLNQIKGANNQTRDSMDMIYARETLMTSGIGAP